MARIRTIKPEFPHSESLGRVSRDARLLFVMLWTICDDAGRARANSRMLASLLFPYDDDAPRLIHEWLFELEREGCIRLYSIDENAYLEIPKWLTHQKIDKPSPSRLPENSRPFAKPREASSGDLVPGPVPRTKDQGPKKEEVAPVALPVWVPLETWNSFLQTRKKVAPHAQSLLVSQLSKLKEGGDDPKEVLEQSIMNGWKGLFPLKKANGHGPGLRKPTATDQHLAGIASLVEDIRERRNAGQG